MYRYLTTAALVVALFAGADWTRFRGPNASGVSEDTGLPTTWSATENVVWKTDLPGFGASSPITLGDKIFLTCYSGYGLDKDEPGETSDLLHHVVCIDRNSGNILWDKRSRARMPEKDYEGFIQLHGYASGTPATDGEAVYAFFGLSGVWAYSVDGELLWKTGVGTGTHSWGSATSVVLHDDLVIINASVESQAVVALDKKTGEEVWRAEDIPSSWSTPLVVDLPDGSHELVVSMEDHIRAYNPNTGELLWHCGGVKDYVCPAVITEGDVVYVTGGRSAARVFAVRCGGRGDVSDSHMLWEVRKTSKVPTPVVHDGLLYYADQRGVAVCLDAETGEEIYEERLRFSGGGGDKVYASPVLADGKLYIVSRQGGTVVLAAGREFEILAHNHLDDDTVFNGTPVVSNGQLLLRSNEALYCIGTK